MSIYFTAEHDMFRRVVRRFVETEINPNVERGKTAVLSPPTISSKRWATWACWGITYPEEVWRRGWITGTRW
jgi:hypothetical protein